ncbi:MAG: hypothetical protein LUD68_01855, partial [Rikenellaceae bacterium]|nr:hypothetical protein [Rikenellaceae bacterium]
MRKIRTKIEYALSLLPILILILSGCTKETVLSRSGNEGCLISFEFSIPTPAEHSRATAKLSNESAISDIYVFAFESGSEKLKDWAEAEVVSASGSVTTGTVKLSNAANGSGTHKLVFLANVKSEVLAALGAGTIAADMDYASFQPVLTTDIGSILTADPTDGFRFPMWGETEYLSLSSTTELTGTKAVAVQRALAKIDVAVNRQTDGTTPGLPDFKLTGVMVYNINFDAVVVPDPDHVGNDRIVTAPT